jgi:superfamily II DNA/RNA helicase
MDYPDVTFVLQVGMTTREQYTHRLGRTARAGKGGSGMLLLQPFEESTMRKELKGFDLILKTGASLGVPESAEEVSATLAKVSRNDKLKESAEKAYKGTFSLNPFNIYSHDSRQDTILSVILVLHYSLLRILQFIQQKVRLDAGSAR